MSGSDRYNRDDAAYRRSREYAPTLEKARATMRARAEAEGPMEVCEVCGGSGGGDEAHTMCSVCGGTGRVPSPLRHTVESLKKEIASHGGVPAPHEGELMFTMSTPTKHGGKYWGIRMRTVFSGSGIQSYVVETRFGAFGAMPQTSEGHSYRTKHQAQEDIYEQVRKKKNKGYVAV